MEKSRRTLFDYHIDTKTGKHYRFPVFSIYWWLISAAYVFVIAAVFLFLVYAPVYLAMLTGTNL